MDRRTFLAASAASIVTSSILPRMGWRAERPRPTASQLEWQRDELAMFLHFGVNTFTDREWGDGREDPQIFAPANLDARQWARTAKAAGFRAMILTAKHHDGFCLWPTRTTTHSVASSPFRGGSGDVVHEFVDACRAEGLKAGLYLSPWDRNNPAYGDSQRYNDLYCEQLTELLTHYGTISEVWFDGANGEGPNGKKQIYDWPRVWSLVRTLQPSAVMFSDAGPDVRWCGNENGSGGDPNWSTVDPAIVTYPGIDGPGITAALQHGHRDGTAWRPAEADTSIRKGWFYHPADDVTVRSADNLRDLYFKSVGRNAKLLLNVPPTRDGLLHEIDIRNLMEFRRRLDSMTSTKLPQGDATWKQTGLRNAELIVSYDAPLTASVARVSEEISNGQRVARYSIFADGRRLVSGTTVGYAKLDRFPLVTFRQIRVVIEDAADIPERIALELFDIS